MTAQLVNRLDEIVAICEAAHEVILPYWRSDLEIESKADDSPVTQADKAANTFIETALKKLAPEIPVVSEEGTQQALDENATFWLVDPVDGTKSFIRGDDEFTVNIALIENRRAILGVLGVPAQGNIYKAALGHGAWKKPVGDAPWEAIKVSQTQKTEPQRVMSSQSHRSPSLEAWLEEQSVTVKERVGASSALKFGLIAEGAADIYPRMGPTMEWDTAAGHCLIEAAGGTLTQLDGSAFLYGKATYLNGGFIARGAVIH